MEVPAASGAPASLSVNDAGRALGSESTSLFLESNNSQGAAATAAAAVAAAASATSPLGMLVPAQPVSLPAHMFSR